MRLIDADALLEAIRESRQKNPHNDSKIRANHTIEHDHIAHLVLEQPNAYDVDKVVERLEQQKNQYLRRSDEIKSKFGENYESQKNYGKACSYDHAIEIVKSGGIE